jgi:hypothetical protein
MVKDFLKSIKRADNSLRGKEGLYLACWIVTQGEILKN